MDQQFITRLEQAQKLLQTVGNAAMATVNADATAHNSPLFIAFSPDLTTVYWSSDPASLHSMNVERSRQAYFVLYESAAGGGLYFPVHDVKVADGDQLAKGLTAYNLARVQHGKKQPLLVPAFQEPNVLRLYQASVTSYSLNMAQRDDAGKIIRDYRQPISSAQLSQPAEDAPIY